MPRQIANIDRFASHLGYRPETGRRANRQTITKFINTIKHLSDKFHNAPLGHARLKPVIILYNYLRFNIEFIFGTFRLSRSQQSFAAFINSFINAGKNMCTGVITLPIYNEYIHHGALSSMNVIIDEFSARLI